MEYKTPPKTSTKRDFPNVKTIGIVGGGVMGGGAQPAPGPPSPPAEPLHLAAEPQRGQYFCRGVRARARARVGAVSSHLTWRLLAAGIAQMTALGGYDVIVQDINEEATDLARFEMIDGRWGMKASVQKGKITYQACEDAIPRLTTTLDQADLADCDLIIEAVPCAPLSPRIHPSLGCCRSAAAAGGVHQLPCSCWSPPQSMAADGRAACAGRSWS